MPKIKLIETSPCPNGTRRFQSQLFFNSDLADFIIEFGVMKHIDYGPQGESYYPYAEDYEIVSSKTDMVIQEI